MQKVAQMGERTPQAASHPGSQTGCGGQGELLHHCTPKVPGALIRMQIPDGRPPQNYRSEITFRIHNFWTQFVYPRFITVQAAFYIWRTTTRAAKANREMQMHLLEIAAPN